MYKWIHTLKQGYINSIFLYVFIEYYFARWMFIKCCIFDFLLSVKSFESVRFCMIFFKYLLLTKAAFI